jgi:hypothetical protein
VREIVRLRLFVARFAAARHAETYAPIAADILFSAAPELTQSVSLSDKLLIGPIVFE